MHKPQYDSMCTPAHPVASQCSISKADAPSSCSERLLRQAHCPSCVWMVSEASKESGTGRDGCSCAASAADLHKMWWFPSDYHLRWRDELQVRLEVLPLRNREGAVDRILSVLSVGLLCWKRCWTKVCAASSRLASPASTRRRRASCSCLRCLCSSSSAS